MSYFTQRPFKTEQAFTLIELVVVISLISLILFFAVPRLDVSLLSNPKRKASAWIELAAKTLKQQAVRQQAGFSLNVDIDGNTMWTSPSKEAGAEADTEEMPRTNEYRLPEGLRLMDVQFSDRVKITSGIARIGFYPRGYSDRAVIHLEDADNRHYSYMIEPFLLHVDVYDRYVEF